MTQSAVSTFLSLTFKLFCEASVETCTSDSNCADAYCFMLQRSTMSTRRLTPRPHSELFGLSGSPK